MGEQRLLTAVACELQFLVDLAFGCLGNLFAVKTRGLCGTRALDLAQSALIVLPLVGQEFAAIHTTNGDDHFCLVPLEFAKTSPRQILPICAPTTP